ncbi:thioredoxin family protein [candidate division KSB1 bacterium]|nr:thioredoxin family protein [candidate division KSB1 bacterium]
MRKQLIGFAVLCSIFFSCSHTRTLSPPNILLGWLTSEQLFKDFPAYQEEKQLYQPDENMIQQLQRLDHTFDVLVFLGIWCPDSKREVPRFFSILDRLPASSWNVRLYGLDRRSQDTTDMREKYQVEFIPTFIIYQNEQEIGRIAERPMLSLEQDLLDICSSASQ